MLRFILASLLLLPLWAQNPALSDAGFDRWVREFWPVAAKSGIRPGTYNAAFAGVKPDPEVLKKADYQPEFVRPLWDYVDSAVSQKRIATGRDMLVRHRRLLVRIESTYGVDRHILVAIWGMESSYGAVLQNPKIVKSVIRSLATLAYGDPRRSRFARKQLIGALQILQNGDISVAKMTGSWAGAMGHTQFIPTTFSAYAVDFTGDGRRDIWHSEADALASAANYLNKAGWRSGKTWGYEVRLPGGFDYSHADKAKTLTISQWHQRGIRRVQGRPFPRPDDKAVLVLPAGAHGPAFLMLRNHYVIKRYNNATAYAIAIGHLADRLRGGDAFIQPWPKGERALRNVEIREIQSRLARAGYYGGAIDGKIGPQSKAAIRTYQRQAGLAPDGFAGATLLSRMRGG